MNRDFKTCYFKIKPSDTLFFQSGHVFEKQVNNYLDSLNIPYPSVFYGAITSAMLRQGKSINNILENIKNRNSSEIQKKLKNNFIIYSIYIYTMKMKMMYM